MIQKLKNPEFLHCENPIKIGDFINDNRQFIYCTAYLSLIEIIPMDDYLANFPKEQTQKEFFYTKKYGETENFLLVFTQNNVDFVNSQTNGKEKDFELLERAWEFYEKYLIWEDT